MSPNEGRFDVEEVSSRGRQEKRQEKLGPFVLGEYRKEEVDKQQNSY